MALAPGSRVEDRYEVEALLGEGGTAVVWRVRNSRLGTLHALKVLRVGSPAVYARLVQEGRVQSALRHPNVVAVTDVVSVDGAPALVMELIEGPTLAELAKAHPLRRDQLDVLVRGVLEGVAAAHAAGIVHRDLKPHNVLLSVTTSGLVPKVTDFGLAKAWQEDASPTATRTGMVMGSPAYMAPEQIRDAKSVTPRSDVFSLGVLIYELLANARPFRGEDTASLFGSISRGEYVPLRALLRDLPERMDRAVEGALHVDPAARWADAGAMLSAWLDEQRRPDTSTWSEDVVDAARTLHAATVTERARALPRLEVQLAPSGSPPPPVASQPPALPAPAARVGWRWLVAGTVVASLALGGASLALRGPSEADPFAVPSLGDPQDDALERRAWEALLRGDLPLASREIATLVAKHPSEPFPALLQHVALNLEGRGGPAYDAVYAPRLRLDPDDRAGSLVLALRDPAEGVAGWVARHPDDLLGHVVAAANLVEGTDWLVTRHPDLPLGWMLAARASARSEDLEAARAALGRAAELTPGTGWVEYQLGTLAQTSGELVVAEAHYREALRREPGLLQVRSGLAANLLMQGEEDEARRLAEAAQDPTVPADLRLHFASVWSLATMSLGRARDTHATCRWGIDLAREERLWSDMVQLVLYEQVTDELLGPFPPPPDVVEQVRELASAPEVPEPQRRHLREVVLALEGQEAVLAGDLERARDRADRLMAQRSRLVGRVESWLSLADGTYEDDPDPVEVIDCASSYTTSRILTYFANPMADAMREALASSPECTSVGMDRVGRVAGRIHVAERALARGDRDAALAATAEARALWPSPDPEIDLAVRLAALEAALGA